MTVGQTDRQTLNSHLLRLSVSLLAGEGTERSCELAERQGIIYTPTGVLHPLLTLTYTPNLCSPLGVCVLF